MKIGILTFHSAHNYGAVLQAYSLKKTIEDMGNSVEVINYRNPNISKAYPSVLSVDISLHDVLRFKTFIKKWNMKCHLPLIQYYWEKKHAKFEQFIEENLLDTKLISTISELEDYIKIYDAIVIGSDQVWEKELLGGKFDSAYIGDFLFSGEIVMYGISKFTSKLEDEEKAVLQKSLQNVDFISAREKGLCCELQHMGNKCVNVVDPTLLMEEQDFLPLLNTKLNQELETQRYIFAYFVVEDKQFNRVLHQISRRTQMPIVELHYYWRKQCKNLQLADIGPNEFLTYIKNATLVLTNSFHGTVFSIIYKKNFWVVSGNNARIQNILNELNLSERIINTRKISVDISKDINYEIANGLKREISKESYQYLIDALQ